MDGRFTMEAWEDIMKGYLYFKKTKISKDWQKVIWKPTPGEPTIPSWAYIGNTQIYRESEITGDERTKESYTCNLTMIQCKYAFLNSQKLEQMSAGDATNDDVRAAPPRTLTDRTRVCRPPRAHRTPAPTAAPLRY